MGLNGSVWLTLLGGPLAMFVCIVAVSIWLARKDVATRDIGDRASLLMPQILAATLGIIMLCLLLLEPDALALWFVLPDVDSVGWVAIGLTSGGLTGWLYVRGLAPGMAFLQHAIGDYVPPGSVLSSLSGSRTWFFVANVLLAPFVEEGVYRALAIPALSEHFGTGAGVALSCLLFAFLHWPGGLWYMLLTGGIAGSLFAGLFLVSDSIWPPFAAHFMLNLVEFYLTGRPIRHSLSSKM